MIVEIEAENAQQAEAIVRLSNEEYILDAEHFAGVELPCGKGNRSASRNQSAMV